ncbi:S-adenosyl-L-methionine-dependent methyltransferase [Fimicolochytrium jonesii]|uniref:S-adenosyl-L-methionine-dependent methyltransferase n=1 Tax=Fimicolochytrium jonesii TaxID=1396493 RepID=UPI0022FEA7E6|nr:S-adenosyl-L-methionine-dependent methyltransferase [Fimicolochytrium jonesii]KAI8819454.1 S-adenosyl-L-methionine-dependent methyltransferase [Fimicolochytrium jonesii]
MEAEGGKSDSRPVVPSADARDPAYFQYYAQFVHQQNMLQDTVRTSAYNAAIVGNGPTMFKDKLVMDIGAGSGILSYFACQAGAQKVYAVEASDMSKKIQKLVDNASRRNPWLKDRIEVVADKIENCNLAKVDTLISEPIGVLLVHERMIESYLVARDRFLKPGGAMIPSNGNIYLAPFTDANLWTQTMAKVRFWEQSNFYGVDFSPLAQDARDEVFGQPVVGCFDSRILLAQPVSHFVDFMTITIAELQNIVIPFTWKVPFTALIHGIAGWFDINLGGMILNTGPYAERTHWQQVRFLLKEPLAVNAFETVKGWMRLTVNMSRSYDIVAEIVTGDETPTSDPADITAEGAGDERATPVGYGKRRGAWALHEQTYVYGADLDYSKVRPEFLAMYTPENAAPPEINMDIGMGIGGIPGLVDMDLTAADLDALVGRS